MFSSPSTEELVDRMVDLQTDELRALFAKKHKELALVTEQLGKTIDVLRSRGLRTHETLWNTCLFLNLASHDLSLLVEDVFAQRDDWHRRFTARHIALLIYETADDIRSLLGGRFREALSKLGLLSLFDTSLRIARKPLDEFWEIHQETLKDIRVKSAAHRDHDALAVLAVIQAIDSHAMGKLGFVFNDILNEIAIALQKMITEASRVRPENG